MPSIFPEIKYYSFEFVHHNHSTFRGKVKALDDVNLNTQLESLLFNRYRRKQDVNKVSVVEINKELFDEV